MRHLTRFLSRRKIPTRIPAATPAHYFEELAQAGACPVQHNVHRGHFHLQVSGDGHLRLTFQFDPANQFRVARIQRRQQSANAVAKRRIPFRRSFRAAFSPCQQIAQESLIPSQFARVVTTVVHDRVAQNPIEPVHGAFSATEAAAAIQSLEQTLLEQILCFRRVRDPSGEKSFEAIPLLQDRIESLLFMDRRRF